MRILGRDRVLGLSLQIDEGRCVKLFNVCFLCLEAKDDYTNDLGCCLCYIESVINLGDESLCVT